MAKRDHHMIPDTMHGDYVKEFTPPVDINPQKVCLTVVDLMYATGDPDGGLGRLLASQGRLPEADYRWRRIAECVKPNTRRLLEYFRQQELRRVFLTYGSEVSDFSDLSRQMKTLCESTNNRVGEREHEIIDEFKPQSTERVFNKITFSAFNSTPIELVLHTYGVQTLVFTGVSTNMCVEHTLRDAAERGFSCILAEDACGADNQAMHDAACNVVERIYGAVMSTDEILEKIEAGLAEPVSV